MAQTLEELRDSLKEKRDSIRGKHLDFIVIDDVVDYGYLTPPPVIAEALKSKRVRVYRMYDQEGILRDVLCPELPEGDCRPGMGESRCGGCDACLLMQSGYFDFETPKRDDIGVEECYAWVLENAKSLKR